MLAARAVVGAGDDDHGGLRGHGAQDLPGHVRGGAVCPGRSPHRRPARPRHRLKLRDVLLPHTGPHKLNIFLFIRYFCFAPNPILTKNIFVMDSALRLP